MIDLKRLRQDPEGSRAGLLRRLDGSVAQAVDALLGLDRERRELLVRAEKLKAERNAASEEVARRKRAREPADELMTQLKASGDEVKTLDARLRDIEADLERQAIRCPISPRKACRTAMPSANRMVRAWGEPPIRLPAQAALGARAPLGILDLPAGAKITGSGFPRVPRPRRASWCRALATSCSICTPGSTATPKWRCRIW